MLKRGNQMTRDLPAAITESRLWQMLLSEDKFISVICSVREIANPVSASIARVMPGFTDHSIQHSDALWSVMDKVLTVEEINRLSKGEAFILAISFYVHDIGMAYGATHAGLSQLRDTSVYKSAKAFLSEIHDEEKTDYVALGVASRELHAINSRKLVIEPIPGSDKYLIENSDIREKWGELIGEVCESHNWPMSVVIEKLGGIGVTPDATGKSSDLAYVASVLRIVDYAHINYERASTVSKILRGHLDSSNIVHWNAQEFILGPDRIENRLRYSTSKSIKSVEAWWLIYELVKGLDAEIVQVGEYLSNRMGCADRFSLEGVASSINPQAFARLVKPLEFEPVDIRFKPDSIERLVTILGGRQLYGNDNYAAIRELIQNSRDAIALKKAMSTSLNGWEGKIEIFIRREGRDTILEVIDNGIGMNQEVIQNYLLGIASDFWHSTYFNLQYRNAIQSEFAATGKYGIGFLSVFMIGDNIEVRTQKSASSNLFLRISGIGTRGAIYKEAAQEQTGTKIRITVTKLDPSLFQRIDQVIKARAPMLEYPISVTIYDRTIKIQQNWWKEIGQEDFLSFVDGWRQNALGPLPKGGVLEFDSYNFGYYHHRTSHGITDEKQKWVGRQPELIRPDCRAVACPGLDGLLLCVKGIAIKMLRIEGISGIANVDKIEIDASRSHILGWDFNGFKEDLLKGLHGQILKAINRLAEEGMTSLRIGFIVKAAQAYGKDLLKETEFPWISTIEHSGSAIFRSVMQFRDMLANNSTIILGFGSAPWTMPKHVFKLFPSLIDNSILVPISSEAQPRFGTYKDDDFVTATLEEHFRASDYHSQSNFAEILEEAVLLKTIVEVIAEEFSLNTEKICSQEWVRLKDDFIYAVIKKPN